MKLSAIIFPSVAACMSISIMFEGWLFYMSIALIELFTIQLIYRHCDDCWQRQWLKKVLLLSCSVYVVWGLIDTGVYYSVLNEILDESSRVAYLFLQSCLIAATATITMLELALSIINTTSDDGFIRFGKHRGVGSDGLIHRSALFRDKKADR